LQCGQKRWWFFQQKSRKKRRAVFSENVIELKAIMFIFVIFVRAKT
jgi:hypothetical protein